MSQCSHFRVLHESGVGSVGFCYGCDNYHLRINGVLSFLSYDQLLVVERNLQRMKRDLEIEEDISDPSAGVQIRLTKNTFLCLTYAEVLEALDMINISAFMKDVNDLVEE